MISLLRKLFFLKKIYFTKTPLAIFLDGFLGFVIIFALYDTMRDYRWVVYLIIAGYVYVMLRVIIRYLIVKFRFGKIKHIRDAKLLKSSVYTSSINYELKNEYKAKILSDTENWKLYDLVFDFYRRTKSGSFRSKQVYYTVFEAKLRRPVPNIIFDNKKAKGQQFRYMFLEAQNLSFEGDFDSYFKVYAPNYYKIDTLSIITPEVMEALIKAHDYDIELVGDRVFLYGPLLDKNDIAHMESIGKMLQSELNDNLDNYADSYVGAGFKRTHTASYARQLLKSPFKPAVYLFFSLLGLFVLIYLAETSTRRLYISEAGVLVYASIITYSYSIFVIIRDNKRANERFVMSPAYQESLKAQ